MYAEDAIKGEEYYVRVMVYDEYVRRVFKGTCLGFNHSHTKVLFNVEVDRDSRLTAFALDKKELIQPVE